MSKLSSARYYWNTNKREFYAHIIENLHFLFSDEMYLKILYRILIGHKLCLDNPKGFNEKLCWLKLHNRKPEYSTMVDKYAVKEYVASKIGKEYVIPCIAVWNSASDIDFEILPGQFVMKSTHSGSAYCVCKDKSKIDKEAIRKMFKKDLTRNLFYLTGEWPYKNVTPRVLAEKFMDDKTGEQLRDYKFFCFNGVPTFMYCSIKGVGVYENFYDMDFNPVLWIDHGFPRHIPEFEKPSTFEEMKRIAAVLSADIPFVRVDLYNVDNAVYFGELTFFDWGGMKAFANFDIDLKLGEYIKLPL